MNPSNSSRKPLRLSRRLPRQSWWIAAGYGGFATLWIFFSDKALGWWNLDSRLLIQLSIYKGVGFVAVTSILLLLLMWWTFGTIESGYASLQAQEAEIKTLNRLYAGLLQVRQAIVSATSRDELFQRICRVLVENGGLRMAWIGWHDPSTHRIAPVAEYGDDLDYIQSLRIYGDDRPEGRGPTGRAFRDAKPFVSNDSLNDPVTKPWREGASRLGIRAVAALPIRLKGEVAGTLNVYATEADYFREQEIALLAEAATDISFAMDNLARDEERRQAEALVLSERRFSDAVIESMPGVLYFYDMQGRFLRWNKDFEEVSGCTPEEIGRMNPMDFFAPEERPLVKASIAEAFSQGESSVEAAFQARNGRSIPYFFTGRRVVFDDRVCLAGVGIDISERKRAEAALRELNSTLESRVAERTGELQAALVRAESAENVVAVLPHRLRHDERGIHGDALEDLEAHALARDETVACLRVDRVRPLYAPAEVTQCAGKGCLHLGLARPAGAVGAFTKVTAGDQPRGFRRGGGPLDGSGKRVIGHSEELLRSVRAVTRHRYLD